MKLVVEGNTATAVARVSAVAPSTVLRWSERAARHARRFDEEHLKLEAQVELQIDELNTHGAGARDPDWVFGAIEVWSRVWLATRVAGGRCARRSFSCGSCAKRCGRSPSNCL